MRTSSPYQKQFCYCVIFNLKARCISTKISGLNGGFENVPGLKPMDYGFFEYTRGLLKMGKIRMDRKICKDFETDSGVCVRPVEVKKALTCVKLVHQFSRKLRI